MGVYRYKPEEVIKWAKHYISEDEVSLRDTGRAFHVSHDTIYWNFKYRLKNLDTQLYYKVLQQRIIKRGLAGRKRAFKGVYSNDI